MLEQTIPDNLNKYQDAETWVDQYFIDNDKPNYFFDTGIEVDDYQLISGGPKQISLMQRFYTKLCRDI